MNESTYYRKYGKRLMDIFISASALLVLFPILFILALLVRLLLGAPIIFKQPRPGKDEKIFVMYKFRSMRDSYDKNGKILPDEARITTFGKFLRTTSLDELPELWNILIGEMSFVGPRPLLVDYLPLYNAEQRKRHQVKPGLTGLAQINGRNAITWTAKFQYDCLYVDHFSFKQDLLILLKTIKKVIIHEGINGQANGTNQKFEGNGG